MYRQAFEEASKGLPDLTILHFIPSRPEDLRTSIDQVGFFSKKCHHASNDGTTNTLRKIIVRRGSSRSTSMS